MPSIHDILSRLGTLRCIKFRPREGCSSDPAESARMAVPARDGMQEAKLGTATKPPKNGDHATIEVSTSYVLMTQSGSGSVRGDLFSET